MSLREGQALQWAARAPEAIAPAPPGIDALLDRGLVAIDIADWTPGLGRRTVIWWETTPAGNRRLAELRRRIPLLNVRLPRRGRHPIPTKVRS